MSEMKAQNIALKLFAVLLGIASFFVISVVAAHPAQAARGPVDCLTDTRNHGVAQNSMVVTFCDEAYVYDVQRSSDNHTPTFISGDKNDEGGTFVMRLVNCGGSVGVAIDGVTAPEGKGCAPLDNVGNFGNAPGARDQAPPDNTCTMVKTSDCHVWDGKTFLYDLSGSTLVCDSSHDNGCTQGDYQLANKDKDFKGPAPGKDYADDVNKLPNSTAEADTCNAKGGALSFIFCPVLNGIAGSITWLIRPDNDFGLVKLLQLPPLKAGTPSGDVVSKVLGNIIAVVDLFYILLFLVIIFANAIPLGIDNYTVKKALPRLIVAIILTQFSFLICSLAIDIGNVLGFGVPSLLFSATAGVPQFAGAGSVGDLTSAIATMSPFLAGAGVFIPMLATIGIIVLVILFVVVAFGILVAFFWLMARYLIVYFLIFLTPLAFAAMVLPGTQKYFKMWGEESIKVLLTFPIVTGMLAGSIVISRILSNVLGAQQLQAGGTYANPGEIGIREIMVGLIPIIALLAIPKTLKWGGKLSTAVGGAIGGYLGAKAGAAKSAAVGGAKSVGKPVIQDSRSRYAAGFGRRAQENVRQGRGRGFSGIAARVLSSNYTPGQRGQIAEAALIEKEIGVGAEAAKGQFATYSGAKNINIATATPRLATLTPETQSKYTQPSPITGNPIQISEAGQRYLQAVDRLMDNPNDVRLMGEVRAGMEHLANINDTDSLALGKEIMDQGGQGDLYSRLSGPVGALGDKAPDAGPGGPYEVRSLRPEQLIKAHHTTVQRMARADLHDGDSLANVQAGFFNELSRSTNRGDVRPETIDALRDFANRHRTAAAGTNERRVADEIDAVIDPATGRWI